MAAACILGALMSLAPVHLNAESTPVKLGATLPLSGNLATYGEQIRLGMELAAVDLKARGTGVEIVSEDTPMSGPVVISTLRKLMTGSKVQGIAGNFSNPAMLSMAPLLRGAPLVAMHTAAMDDEILAASGGWIFSTNTRIRDEAKRLAEYAHGTGARRAAIVTIETNFGLAYREHFKRSFEALGGSIVADENYQLGDTDYRAQLTKVRAAKPEIVFGATFGHFLGLTLRQARELGIAAPFISVYESEDRSVLEAAGAHANGLRYFTSYAPTAEGGAAEVRRRLAERLQQAPSTFSLNAYDATVLLAEAVVKCSGASPCVADTLRRVKDYDGVSGRLSIGADGAAERSFYLNEVRDGKFVPVSG